MLPENAFNIVIPADLSTVTIDNNVEPVQFEMFSFSYPNVVGGPDDNTVLLFGTDTLFRQLCSI